MPTSPERIRRALLRVTTAAQREIRLSAADATQEPEPWRANLFAVAPLVVAEYAPAAATLSLDWFEEIRDEARPTRPFTPTARLNVADDDVAAMLARATEAFRDPADLLGDEFERRTQQMLAQVEAELQKQVAAGFWDTTTENADDDPEAVGWQRFTRAGACKFCLMLAARGAVYSESTARFAAHTTCHCVAGPSYDPDAPKADAVQYLASARRSSDPDVQAKRNARIRAYVNEKFPDAPG